MGDPGSSKPQIGLCCNALITAIRPAMHKAVAGLGASSRKHAKSTFA
jgi:hypothetical protein